MTDLPDIRHVKPAHPDATIPDPAHRRDLPSEGYPVAWTAHWAKMLARGDVVVVEPSEEPDEVPVSEHETPLALPRP